MSKKGIASKNQSPEKENQQFRRQQEVDDDRQDLQSQQDVQYFEGSTQRYVGSREARKKAEEDAKLLQNRIQLLKLEEKKAWKKIEETKKKAREIMQVRQRNQETQKQKEQRNKEREEDERMLQEKNFNMKQGLKDGMQNKISEAHSKNKEKAEQVKYEKQEVNEFVNMQRQQEHLKNSSIKQMVKNQEMEVEDRKKRDQAEKKAKGRQELQRKIYEENQQRLTIEMEVGGMEQEELELINRLQNTQLLQKAAYDDLENALGGTKQSLNLAEGE